MSSQLKVSDKMTSYPEVATPNMTVAEAWLTMSQYKIRHLPVINKDVVVGIVSERDLLPYLEKGKTLLKEVMITNVYKVKRGQYLHKVAEEMAEKKYGCAIVENDDGAIVGIFTVTDALYLLSRLLKGANYSSLKLDQINWSRFPEYMI